MSRYQVYITPSALHEARTAAGNFRRRIRKAVRGLAQNPHPSKSKALQAPDAEYSICRLRIDNWRIVYAVHEARKVVFVLAVRKRPPYDYGDLQKLLDEIG